MGVWYYTYGMNEINGINGMNEMNGMELLTSLPIRHYVYKIDIKLIYVIL